MNVTDKNQLTQVLDEKCNLINEPQVINNVRDSKMEILRIIGMILIIMHHFACHGGWIIDSATPVFNKYIIDLFKIGGKIGVNIFVMLSGYYLVKGKFKLSKFFKLIFEVFTYSMLIYIVFLISGRITFGFDSLIKNFLPVIFYQYWFITIYIIVYLISPYINKLISQLQLKEYIILLAILLIIQCIISVISNNYFSYVGWFITIYMLGAFINLYGEKFLSNFKVNLIVFILCYVIMFVFEAFLPWSIYSMNSIVCLVATISLFSLFSLSRAKCSNRIINLIASTTFGIYLIHDNNYIRSFLWQELLKCPQMLNSNYFVLFAFVSVIGTFVVCCLLDILRRYLIEKPITKLLKKA
ncbi:MAG: acyltransferase [Clostridia bacterium]|nr:acyltransferase [Clostridia bacterium]